MIESPFVPNQKLEDIRMRIDLILKGEKNRIFDFESANYYFRHEDFQVEYRGIEFRLSALYCDALFTANLLHEQNYGVDYLIKVLDQILKAFNVVIYERVIECWKDHDKELLEHLLSNYITHFISLPKLLVPRRGLLISKLKSEVTNTEQLNKRRIGENVRRIRTLKRLRQEELADKALISIRTLRSVEIGETNKFYFSTLEKVANALRVEVSQLL